MKPSENHGSSDYFRGNRGYIINTLKFAIVWKEIWLQSLKHNYSITSWKCNLWPILKRKYFGNFGQRQWHNFFDSMLINILFMYELKVNGNLVMGLATQITSKVVNKKRSKIASSKFSFCVTEKIMMKNAKLYLKHLLSMHLFSIP